jgi:hypothetical protein
LLQGRVLRSGDPAGLEQEAWALLALYQALRPALRLAVPGGPPSAALPSTTPNVESYCYPLFPLSSSILPPATIGSA